MKFNQAFDATLKHFKISGKFLSEQSGIATASISEFRRGRKAIQTDSLEKLLHALPPEAKIHFFSSLLGGEEILKLLVSGMDNDGLSKVMIAIANKLKDNRQNTSINTDEVNVAREALIVS